jgi:two-component system, OmpR family, phosphate regulon response regulator PhoB
MAARVLVVEDDRRVQKLISWRLEADGHRVHAVDDGTLALAALERRRPDVLILDLNLPGVPGLDVLRGAEGTPTIIVSARTSEQDRILGLDAGADDYLVKPFSPDELAARVRALLRRTSGTTTIEAGALVIDREARQVRLDGRCIELSPREFDLLAFLAASPRRPFTREQLLRHVWHSSAGWQDPGTVTQHMHRLRHKLECDPAHPVWLQTVSRAGYRFDP